MRIREIAAVRVRYGYKRIHALLRRERWIGFGFGVLASLLASFLWFAISLLWKARHNKIMQPTAGGGG
jgi:hypothetical protein